MEYSYEYIESEHIVTYVRFPWLNNVSTAVTMDTGSTTLLHFLSYATILDGLSADNNVNKQHCCARNNGRAFLWIRIVCLRTSTEIGLVCVGIHSGEDVV
jgi:hypothetical protein